MIPVEKTVGFSYVGNVNTVGFHHKKRKFPPMTTPETSDILEDLEASGDLTIDQAQKGDEMIKRRTGKDLSDLAAFLQMQNARGSAARRTYAKRIRD